MSTTTFHAVNGAGLVKDAHMEDTSEVTTPTTPKAPASQISHTSDPKVGRTPLRVSNATPPPPTDISSQHPISDDSSRIPSSESSQETIPQNMSQHSNQSTIQAEMELDGSDDDQDGSGDDTEGGDSGRPSKKKKGQRFFCTEFPPCNLSFTRSEHLARHIRKHTGERPFQCHCNRRFSRLDNLRQHAQTVHVNEEIPGDSLAATGTRFQRQIRTDRVRTPGRARSGTGGNQAAHSRGHSRNLSTSSIGSTASNYSTVQEASKRRPPPLIMANDSSRARLSLDTNPSPPTTPPNQFSGFSTQSPGGFSTPTSATFSAGPGSPGFGSTYASPASSRNPNYYGARTPGRRLSVPTGTNPFQSPHGNTQPPPYLSPLAPSSASFSNNGSVFGSPTSSTFSFARGDPNAIADADWRRRTWHPSTYSAYGGGFNSRPATSSLSYSQTPDAPQPAFAPNATTAASQAPRLPGIESFDQVQHRPSTPPRRRPSPMQIDNPNQISGQPPPQVQATQAQPRRLGHRRGHISWDLGLHSNLSREAPKDFTQWGQQTINEIEHVGSQLPMRSQPLQTSGPGQVVVVQAQPQPIHEVPQHQPTTPQRNKRHGWYNGPLSTATSASVVPRTSPEDSSSSEGVPTPGTSATEYHPAIMHSNGYIEAHHPSLPGDSASNACIPPPSTHTQPPYPLQQTRNSQTTYFTPQAPPANDMGRLEALVAVATSEEKAATTAR